MDGPLTLNELNVVLLTTVSIIVVVPPTFKLPLIFTVFKLDIPDTFNDDNNVESPDIIKLLKLVLLNIVFDVACRFDIDDIVDVEKFEKVVLAT